MKVSFELSPRDIRFFRDRLKQARAGAASTSEPVMIRGAENLVREAIDANPPDFVVERIRKLEQLIEMLRDSEGQSQHELAVHGVAPGFFEVRDPAGDDDQVERTIADHLVGDGDVDTPRVASLRLHHVSVARRLLRSFHRSSSTASSSSICPHRGQRRFPENLDRRGELERPEGFAGEPALGHTMGDPGFSAPLLS